MKNFTLDDIKRLIDQSLKEEPTGDDWLDSRYNEQVHWIGHTNPYYKLFYLIAKELKPELTVELGSWQATGAAHFAAGNPNGLCITCDIHREDKAAQLRTIEAAGHYENLTYLNRWTWDAVPFIQNLNTLISIIFIDAWHDYQYAKKEWDLYSPLMASPALVICDDITTAYNFDGMLKFWEEMPEPKFLFSQGLHGDIPMGFVLINPITKNELQTKELVDVGQDRGTDSVKSTGTSKRGRPSKKS
jgi:predicted O-methyltransferase YrrM